MPATFVWFEIVLDSRAGMLSPTKKKIRGQVLLSNIGQPQLRTHQRETLYPCIRFVSYHCGIQHRTGWRSR